MDLPPNLPPPWVLLPLLGVGCAGNAVMIGVFLHRRGVPKWLLMATHPYLLFALHLVCGFVFPGLEPLARKTGYPGGFWPFYVGAVCVASAFCLNRSTQRRTPVRKQTSG